MSLRDGPGVENTRIAKLNPGDLLRTSHPANRSSIHGDWLMVDWVNGGELAEHGEPLSGWVHSNVVKVTACPL